MMTSSVRSPAPPVPGETVQPARSTPDVAASLLALLFGTLLQGTSSGPAAARAGLGEGGAPAVAPPLPGESGASRAGEGEPALLHGAARDEPAGAQADARPPEGPEIACLPPFGRASIAPGQDSAPQAEPRMPGHALAPRGENACSQPGALARAHGARGTTLGAGNAPLPPPEGTPARAASAPGAPLAPGSGQIAAEAALDQASGATPPAVLGAPAPRHAPTGRAPAVTPAASSASQASEGASTPGAIGASRERSVRALSAAASGWKIARALATSPPAGAAPDQRDGSFELSAEILEANPRLVERGAEPASAPVRAAAPPPPALQIGMQIARAASSRIERMVVELDPAELGRIEIRLEFGEEGRVRAAIAAERVETLDWLQRDAAALERSLREAGLRPDAGGLSFSLRREQPDGQGGDHGFGQRMPARAVVGPGDAGAAPAHEAARLTLRLLDIRA